MVGNSQAALQLAEVLLGSLIVLAVLRVRTIWRKPPEDEERRPLASFLAAVFGVLALVSLGVFLPLDVIDRAFGSTNITNLVQSLLTVCAFWFFRVAVRTVVFPEEAPYRPRLLLALLAAITVLFFLIEDRGITSPQFMAEHSDQLANVAYNALYMSVLGWVVLDMLWTLRHQQRAFRAFQVGLALVALSCIDEIAYVVLAHVAPGAASEVLYVSFYVLFFGGILVVAAGWFWVLIKERGYLTGLFWRTRSVGLVPVWLRVHRKAKRKLVARPMTSEAVVHTPDDGSYPRLKVARYVAPPSSRSLLVLPAESAWDIARTLLGMSSEDVVYRLIVQIRNTAARHGIELSPADSIRVRVAEEKFPGF